MAMYPTTLRFALGVLLLIGIVQHGFSNNDSLSIDIWFEDGVKKMQQIQVDYEKNSSNIYASIDSIDQLFKTLPIVEQPNPQDYLTAMYQRIRLKEAAENNDQNYEFNLLKLRYRKAIELIKLLYEKNLSLDHHFSSLKAHQQILKLTNPQNYPDFKHIQANVKEQMRKKHRFRLPRILESNSYISATFSLISTIIPGNENKNKQKDFEKISCILDFTVRMNADLNIIYFETEFLREANARLKAECESLFKDCTKIIGYKHALNECREQDDWEMVYDLLDRYVEELIERADQNTGKQTLQKKEVNLRFTIDRVVDYINQYLTFITQSREYYSKFNKIIFSYENMQICIEQLPQEYLLLKKDINTTIEKFNHSYYMPELKGSRLKGLLYGEPNGQ